MLRKRFCECRSLWQSLLRPVRIVVCRISYQGTRRTLLTSVATAVKVSWLKLRYSEAMEPDPFSARINKLPKWARGYIHEVETFCGAEEVEELIQLRDQRRQLIKLIAELKA